MVSRKNEQEQYNMLYTAIPEGWNFLLPVGCGNKWNEEMFHLGDWIVGVLAKGKVTAMSRNETVEITEDHVVVGTVKDTVFLGSSEDCLGHYIVIHGGLEVLKLFLTDDQPYLVQKDSDSMIWHAMDRLADSFSSGAGSNQYKDSAKLYQFLMDLLSYQNSPKVKCSSLVQEAKIIMKTKFMYLEGVEDLADQVGVHKSHLIRLFKAEVGVTPGQYLQHIRLEYAKLLLAYKSYDLETIADMVGYSGANYFCKVFHRAEQITPGKYRQRYSKHTVETPDVLSEWEKSLHI